MTVRSKFIKTRKSAIKNGKKQTKNKTKKRKTSKKTRKSKQKIKGGYDDDDEEEDKDILCEVMDGLRRPSTKKVKSSTLFSLNMKNCPRDEEGRMTIRCPPEIYEKCPEDVTEKQKLYNMTI